jgi:hypothetical protein
MRLLSSIGRHHRGRGDSDRQGKSRTCAVGRPPASSQSAPHWKEFQMATRAPRTCMQCASKGQAGCPRRPAAFAWPSQSVRRPRIPVWKGFASMTRRSCIGTRLDSPQGGRLATPPGKRTDAPFSVGWRVGGVLLSVFSYCKVEFKTLLCEARRQEFLAEDGDRRIDAVKIPP